MTKQIFSDLVQNAAKKAMDRRRAEIEKVEKEIANRWPNTVKTPSGLQYVVLKKGDGKGCPKYGNPVTVHYTGTLLDGRMFDSSINRGQPATFKIGQVIEGWNEALVTMSRGEKRTLIIPPELGYGVQGYPGIIPPNSYLIFDVELLDF